MPNIGYLLQFSYNQNKSLFEYYAILDSKVRRHLPKGANETIQKQRQIQNLKISALPKHMKGY